ncbi:MAG: acetoacetate--CoA ligase [Mycobacterium sp.]
MAGKLDPIWIPSSDDIARARVTAFAAFSVNNYGYQGSSYLDLWQWSVVNVDDFWNAVWTYFGVDSPTPPRSTHVGTMPDVRWFDGAEVSYVAHLFKGRPDDAVAIVDVQEAEGDERRTRQITWPQLRDEVATVAAELTRLGVGPGDRVVGYVPNAPEAIVGFLAAAAVGAVWSGCGQDYSASAAAQRFAQLEPTVLIAADGYRYAGRVHDRRAAVAELVATLPTVTATLMFERVGVGARPAGVMAWPATEPGRDLQPLYVPSDHPLWVLFSSGTTGRPKGIVHSTGGVLLEHLKSMGLALDLGPDDTFFWYTSPSWMVWNYLVSALLVGARVVCFDGSPTHPSPDTVWSICAEHKVTLLGTSPAHLKACAAAELRPGQDHDLSALRSIGSSGSILPAAAYHYVAEHIGSRIRLNSTTGGTDIVSSFAGSGPTTAVWPGYLSAPALGVALESWDTAGRPVRNEVGELVVTAPMPSMPIYFWGDSDGRRYRSAYFDDYPGTWRHGDWITINDEHAVMVHGRSDATLNRNGVRMGSADIYQALEAVSAVAESLVVGVEQTGGAYWMPLFVALVDGAVLDDDLRSAIRTAIRDGASPRHLPDDIIQIAAVPHTLTGKKLEVPVKRILLGQRPAEVVDLGAVDRPDVLVAIAELTGARSPS